MMKTLYLVLILLMGTVGANDVYYLHGSEKRRLVPLERAQGQDAAADYYRTEKGVVVGVRDRLILSLRPGIPVGTYVDRYGMTLLKAFGRGLYLLQVASRSQTIAVANALCKETGVVYAQPDFIKKAVRR